MENPRQSFYWRTSMFARIAHLFQFTAFQSCAYGSRRPKWTAIASRGAFDGICKSCPGTPAPNVTCRGGWRRKRLTDFLLRWKLRIRCHWPVLSPRLSFSLPAPAALAYRTPAVACPWPGRQSAEGLCDGAPCARTCSHFAVRIPPHVSCPVPLRARLKDPCHTWPSAPSARCQPRPNYCELSRLSRGVRVLAPGARVVVLVLSSGTSLFGVFPFPRNSLSVRQFRLAIPELSRSPCRRFSKMRCAPMPR